MWQCDFLNYNPLNFIQPPSPTPTLPQPQHKTINTTPNTLQAHAKNEIIPVITAKTRSEQKPKKPSHRLKLKKKSSCQPKAKEDDQGADGDDDDDDDDDEDDAFDDDD